MKLECKNRYARFKKNSEKYQHVLNPEKGFSLIELLISMAIIALLFTVAIPSYQAHFKKARANEVKSDLLMLANQLEIYRQNKSTYSGAKAETIYYKKM